MSYVRSEESDLAIVFGIVGFLASLWLTWYFWFLAETPLLAIAFALVSLGFLAGIFQYLLGEDGEVE